MSSSTPAPLPEKLPEKPGGKRNLTIGLTAGVVVALVAGFGIWRATADEGGSGQRTVKLGITEASADWVPPLKEAARAKGINLETVAFSDYNQANPALAQKQIDLNLFQHLQFLASYNVNDNQNLKPVGSTVVVPLPLYSQKHKTLAQIPQGGQIAIPNDATNQARALLVLQSAGLLKLKGGGNALSTPADVDTAASKVKVTPVDAAQTVASLKSVDGAIVNNNFALDAKLDPKTALVSDDPSKPAAEPYINVFVSRDGDQDNADFKEIVRLYHTEPVLSKVKAQSKNTAIIVDRPVAQLNSILARLEKDLKTQ